MKNSKYGDPNNSKTWKFSEPQIKPKPTEELYTWYTQALAQRQKMENENENKS